MQKKYKYQLALLTTFVKKAFYSWELNILISVQIIRCFLQDNPPSAKNIFFAGKEKKTQNVLKPKNMYFGGISILDFNFQNH